MRQPGQTDAGRAVGAILLIYLGVFAVLLLVAERPWGERPESTEQVIDQLLLSLGCGVLGLAALLLLGRGSLRQSLAGPASGKQVGVGIAVGLAGIVVVVPLLHLLNLVAFQESSPTTFARPEGLFRLLITTAVLPALVEEWTDRGVLWTALRRVADVRTTIVLTAILFGLSHGLNGAGFLEAPTRILLGLAFGALRAWSGSLWPGIAAHFTVNAVACFLGG